MNFQVDQQPPIILMNDITEVILPLSYGKHIVSIVAVDRCNRQSQADVRQLKVQKGECDRNVHVHSGIKRTAFVIVHLSLMLVIECIQCMIFTVANTNLAWTFLCTLTFESCFVSIVHVGEPTWLTSTCSYMAEELISQFMLYFIQVWHTMD